ncbi:sensor histidine kinase [Massilia sp. TWP1-3-3]|uniref:sensor histidine kinase n=1 Tax=Massilia sp. TWP1-3-3 TaxID=2804573 RepID=UPI003CED7352
MLVVELCLAAPILAIINASIRLYAASRRTDALVRLIDGSLLVDTVLLRGNALDCESEMARQIERITSGQMPGLGRLIYGSHAKLTKRIRGKQTVHALTWLGCPMHVEISMHALENGLQQLRVRTVRSGGLAWFVAAPLDAIAQMQYMDSNLVQPLVNLLERRTAQRQREALHNQAIEAQLRILQAQIEPHFLFNTLANLRQLYRTSAVDGESMLDHLIAYLRSAMENLRAEYSSVVQEMDLAMHYLAIMQIRMGSRLAYRFVVPDALLKHPLPPAMLISLVENAVKHGIAESSEGVITLSVARIGAALHVSIADNGPGISSVGGTGLGLSNIRQRLEAIYGSSACLEVGSPVEGGFTGTIIIPFEEGVVHADRIAG